MSFQFRHCEEPFATKQSIAPRARGDGIFWGLHGMARDRQPAVYIMASGRNGTLYVGVTSNLVQRVSQHRIADSAGFASRYGCTVLVFYEVHVDMAGAIAREKQIKAARARENWRSSRP